jgi:hypothetical protein
MATYRFFKDGIDYTNHKNQAVAARATGADCRYALDF